MEQRWRYEDETGRAIWLAFDPQFLCVYCERAVAALSFGGPAVCPSCDCGTTEGRKWTFAEFWEKAANARKRFNEMSDDPAWADYEATITKRDRATAGDQ